MTTFAVSNLAQGLAVLVLAAAVAARLLVTDPKLRAWLGAAVIVLAPLALLTSVTGDNQASLPKLSAPLIAALAVAGAGAVVAATFVFSRWPRLLVPAAILAIPFRVPLDFGGQSSKLLVPLYLVIAGSVGAELLALWRARDGDRRSPRSPRLLDLALAAAVVLYAVQTLYSDDSSAAIQNLTFFYAPFALLYGLFATARWDRKLVDTCFAVLTIVALLLVAAGFIEASRSQYLISPGGIQPNEFDPYFRIQSLFFDPNIFGRFIALVIIGVATFMLFVRSRLKVLAGAAIAAVLWAGLVLTQSQSSIAALLVGLIVLAALCWNPKPVLTAAGALALIGVVLIVAAPGLLKIDLNSDRGADAATSGRFDLVNGGLKIFADRPVQGYGSGSYSKQFVAKKLALNSSTGPSSTSKSHTSPVTTAAEQGLVGLAAYIFLIVAAFQAVFRRTRDFDRPGYAVRIGVAAAFTALVFHTLAYAAFLEDPIAWALLGAAVSLNGYGRRETEGAPAPQTEPVTE